MLNKLQLLMVILPTGLHGQAGWRMETWFGEAINAPSQVTFQQTGKPDIAIVGKWSTKPWKPTWYYGGRVSRWQGNSAWALEYLHHKIYLENPAPPEVDFFRITNGINNLLAERVWRTTAGLELGIGVGPVFAVPVSKVRGSSYGGAYGVLKSRYEFAGETVALTLSRPVSLIPHLSGSFALMGTVSRLNVSIADGKARLNNYALHFHYGIALQTAR